jgi:deazaflavin-dependent oxidoreductase (nitroreductase family)
MAGMKGNVQSGLRLFTRVMRPLALRTAGRESSGTAVIRHVGRTSGKAYDTPVTPARHDDSFFIALPYGPRTDWLRNVLAAGAATLVVRGQEYRVGQPEVLPVAEAAEYFPAGSRRMLRRFGVESVLRLRLLT